MTATLTSTDIDNDRCPACGKALSRLTAPPLPEEITRLIERLEGEGKIKVAAALRALAQENERLKLAVRFVESDLPMKTALERIAELEDENDRLRESVNAIRAEYLQHVFDEKARADQLEAEREELFKAGAFHQERAKAIRAKTFEECALVLDRAAAALGNRAMADFANDMASNIRALTQMDEASQKEQR